MWINNPAVLGVEAGNLGPRQATRNPSKLDAEAFATATSILSLGIIKLK